MIDDNFEDQLEHMREMADAVLAAAPDPETVAYWLTDLRRIR